MVARSFFRQLAAVARSKNLFNQTVPPGARRVKYLSKMKKIGFTLVVLGLWSFGPLVGQELVNATLNQVIRKHGLEKSQVMETAHWLTDVYGPRLTGSPMLDKATTWAEQTLKGWGLSNVHRESWGPFGRGWEMQHFTMHATAPSYFPLIAYPKAWSPSLKGTVKGEVVYLSADDTTDLVAYRGKLKGKFVFLEESREVTEWFKGPAQRHTAEELAKMADAPLPTPRPNRDFNRLGGFSFNQKLWEFLAQEKPLAVIDRNFKGDLGAVFLTGARVATGRAYDPKQEIIPQVTLAVEHYNRILRLLASKIPVTLSMELKTTYTNPDGLEHNLIAEIPGTDKADEVVMFGAHLDSWHTGTGATDNAAGSAVMMEVARILQATIAETGIRPRRTLRLALWTGEEQGLLGSRAYVREHFGQMSPDGTVQDTKPAQGKVSAYYNLDNGTGKVRGIYLQGNAAARPLFAAWLAPFADLEANTTTLSNTGGTDHQAFDAVGIPGFQFIQDPIAYSTRTHHSNMDQWDHLVAADLQQAATVIASIVMHTAQREELLPRKPQESTTKTGGN